MNDDINFIKKLPIDEQKDYLKAYLKADQLETQTRVKGDFLEFIKLIHFNGNIFKLFKILIYLNKINYTFLSNNIILNTKG